MDAIAIVALINSLLAVAYKLYDSASQIQGDTPIPSWEEISDKNKLLQDKIDTEKGA